MVKDSSQQRLRRIEFKERLYRRRYLVPNAVTLGNLFCGFLTIIYASSGRFEKAAIAIGIAILLDGLDGRVARRLNATSRFGLEFDSFSDLVSFGVAPALLTYHWCFQVKADEFGVFVCFLYSLCAASRLARFNIRDENLTRFEGLPSPGAAGMVAATVNLVPHVEPSFFIGASGTVVILSLAWLMVSRITYPSIKSMKVQNMQLWMTVGLGGGIALVWYNTGIGFVTIAVAYIFSGPFLEFRKKWSSESSDVAAEDVQEAS